MNICSLMPNEQLFMMRINHIWWNDDDVYFD